MKRVNDDRSSGDWPESPETGPALDGEVLAPGSALVTTAAPERAAHGPLRGLPPSAPFLAQLIATAQQAPQTRARRRAEPADATAIYIEGRRRLAPAPYGDDWLM